MEVKSKMILMSHSPGFSIQILVILHVFDLP